MEPFKLKYELILASSSKIRANLLKTLGFEFSTIAADLDERELLKQYADKTNFEKVRRLAEAKAIMISESHRDSLVIGADQMIQLDSEILGKPGNLEKNIEQLCRLQSRKHQLLSGWALCLNAKILASGTDIVNLKMRHLNQAMLRQYALNEKAFNSCGGYYYESMGRLLFERVEGSYDSVLGLPLEPIINVLWKFDLINTL